MGGLFSRLVGLFSEKQHRLVIVGLDNAGKSTIFYQFALNDVVVTSPTIGSNVEDIQFKNLKFSMWDVGGQDSLRESWETYYSGAEGLIFVVDSTDVDRMSIAKKELHKMMAHEDLRTAQVLIYANKQDAKGALSASDISQSLSLTTMTHHSYHIQACCALTGEGLYEGMEWLAGQLKK
eukprot:m.23659 g.23659  ORF g.23659 m.23659 type:complete len:179 (+) comp7528_c0_seq2:173-709(+)